MARYAPAPLPTLRPPTPARADLSRQPTDCGGAIQASAVPGRITVRQILDVTAAHFGTTVEALTSGTRKWPVVRQRQVAMAISRRLTSRSLPYIARKLGRRDHTTCLHACKAVQARIDAGDAATIAAVNAIVEKLTGGANV